MAEFMLHYAKATLCVTQHVYPFRHAPYQLRTRGYDRLQRERSERACSKALYLKSEFGDHAQ
jgi:hypothetical protein